jgi:hypothetical protein
MMATMMVAIGLFRDASFGHGQSWYVSISLRTLVATVLGVVPW